MGNTLLHIADWLLWLIIAASTVYIFFFALCSLLPRRKEKTSSTKPQRHSFLVLFPAYKEDAVIVHSVTQFVKQQYPKDLYHVAVISDHMQPETNQALAQLPVTVLQPTFEKSSKAKALQFAVKETEACKEDGRSIYDYVVILDADNVVGPDFLAHLNAECNCGHRAIQCHRTAKNSNNDIAMLDGISEEINNSIFRKGHTRIGMSSALIGSGMCFDYQWFADNVVHLNSAVEDRELEALLMKQNIFIRYAEDIHVMDEKVSSQDNFQRQRLRWMTGQIQTLVLMVPYIPKAICKGNINYMDKTLQQALIPRSILIALLTIIPIIITIFFPVWSIKWWILLTVLVISLLTAIPAPLRLRSLGNVFAFPALALRMLKNIFHIDYKSNDFIHTTHDK